MTTPLGQDPRPGPARGGPARPAPRGAASDWSTRGLDRGFGQERGQADLGKDDADYRRGGDTAGTDGRIRGSARPDSDPWQLPGAPGHMRGGPGGERGGAEQGWGARPGGGSGAAPGRSGQGGDLSGTGPTWRGRDSGDRAGTGPTWNDRGGERSGTGPSWSGQGGDRAGTGPGWDGQGGAGRGYREMGADPGRRDSGRARASTRGGEDRAAELTESVRPFSRTIGALPTRVGIYVLVAAALTGVVGTLVTGRDPGTLLGFFVIVGSVVAALVIRRRSVYVLIPLPALTLFLTAVLTGAVKDSSIDTSQSALGVSFLQWIADVFVPICAATILVLVIGGARWLLSRQFVTGQFRTSAERDDRARAPRTAPRPGPPPGRDRRSPRESDPWGAVAPWNDRDSAAGKRPSRDPRDPWGDQRQPPGRQPSDRTPSGQQPGPRPVDRLLRPDGTSQNRTLPPDRTVPPGRPVPPERTVPPDRALPPERTLPPERGQRGPRAPWDGRDSRGGGSQRVNRDPREPWSNA